MVCYYFRHLVGETLSGRSISEDPQQISGKILGLIMTNDVSDPIALVQLESGVIAKIRLVGATIGAPPAPKKESPQRPFSDLQVKATLEASGLM